MTPLKKFARAAEDGPVTERMPAFFVGHGSPMNLIEDNAWSAAWTALGERLPRPRAVLCVSAHWYVQGTFVHAAERPRTIHDFYGFPPELYARRYPCPGAPEAADEARELLGKEAERDLDWGIDHGAWMPLGRIFPDAGVPVFQLSIDYARPASWHYDLARKLAPLRRRGIMIVGSGNIVHNLGMLEFEPAAKPFDWAEAFDQKAKKLILDGDHRALIGYDKLGEEASLAVPTPDHYLPMLSVLALREKGEEPSFFVEGMAHASVSMRGFIFD